MKTTHLFSITSLALAVAGCGSDSSVAAHEVELTLPTYKAGTPDPNPRFYSGRAYQGAQGRVYPYPMLDQLTDERVDVPYKMLYLENQYVRVGVLPEIGGRVFEAVDKTNEYDFLYRQHVIKPALIGMLGAWISGGIEWNFPHHHRSRSFMPMDYTIVEHADGAKTIWLSELELRQRMHFTVGITVYPGKSYFEATIKPFNRTPLVQSFLYWANPAVHAGPAYQVMFPPSTEWATYHSKNDFARWPIADDSYRGVDYEDVNLTWWENHPTPISFFAWNYEDDFLAGYDHEQDAGVVYFANHHIAQGKKLWEWGPGPQGSLWDQILTDDDGPYIELMAGAYSDNQPDYSWLQPYESKFIRQYWYPIRGIGGVKNATLEAAVNLDVSKGVATIGFYSTSRHDAATVQLMTADSVLFYASVSIDPARPYVTDVQLPSGVDASQLRASLTAGDQELVSYQHVDPQGSPRPEPVRPPLPPRDIPTVEQLYLTAQRLEQFHNPSVDATEYYEEALRRDPGHSRSNVALGLRYLRNGLLDHAEGHFVTALSRVTAGYTSPGEGSANYYLGLTWQLRHQYDEAYDAYYRATWSSAYHAAAYYRLAQIDCLRENFAAAMEHLDRSIATNRTNRNALNLRAAVLRRLGRGETAVSQVSAVLEEDPLDVWALYELQQAQESIGAARDASRTEQRLVARRLAKFALQDHSKPWHEAEAWLDAQPFIETAVEYGTAGMWADALGILSALTEGRHGGAVTTYPMVHYYAAYYMARLEHDEAATELYRAAMTQQADYCFPSRLEAVEILRAAQQQNPADALAHYCLGNLLYEKQADVAVREWEAADSLGTSIATVYRNIARAHVELNQDVAKAASTMERAVELDPDDPRLYYELDLLNEAAGLGPAERLAVLEQAGEVVLDHNDALGRQVVLLTQLGRYDEAIELMTRHHFRRWEGLGNIHTTYVDAHLLRARQHLSNGRYGDAIRDYESALEYPANLEVAEPYAGGRECQIYYLMGDAYAVTGDTAEALRHYELAATAKRPSGRSVLDYYEGMALRRLGRQKQAHWLFDALSEHARNRLTSLQAGSSLEFFTKFGSRRSLNEQRGAAYYLLGLGSLGNRDLVGARAMLYRTLEYDPNHLWAREQLAQLPEG
jgi:tetratricopeptide (TPR) repeat protein